jgi:putative transposase
VSFFATLKNEMYYRQRFGTRARARFAVAEHLEIFFSRQRLHSYLGYRTTAEALADHQTRAAADHDNHQELSKILDTAELSIRGYLTY